MVRVPGGSKGCHTCRHRKKRCDLQQPSCGQCLKRNVPCSGYERKFKFIDVSHQRGDQPFVTAANSAKGPGLWPHLEENALWDSPMVNQVVKDALSPQAEACQLSAITDYCQSFFLHDFLQARLKPVSVRESSALDWIGVISQLNAGEQSLKMALLALGAASISRSCKDVWLKSLSSQSYSLAIRSLRKAIQKGPRILTNEALASMMLLAFYEVLDGSSKRGLGWVSHTYGAVSLIQLQGLDIQWSEAKLRLFLGLRLPAIIRDIGARRSSFLSSPEWITKPFHGLEKGTWHELLDLMANIPSLLEDIDSTKKNLDLQTMADKLAMVSMQCSKFISALNMWYASFQVHIPHPIFWEEPSRLYMYPENPYQENPLSTSIHFSDIVCGQSMVLYWAVQLLIFSNLWMLYEKCNVKFNQGHEDILSSFPGSEAEIRKMAVDVARSLEYFLQPHLISVGVPVITFPVSIAMGYFEYLQLPELKWFRLMFNHARGLGIDMEDFLDALGRESNLTSVA